MRTWLHRGVLTFWVVFYFLAFRTMAPILLIPILGIWRNALITFIAMGVWSTVFYLLLLRETGIERIRERLVSLKGKSKKSIRARILRRIPGIDEPTLFSPFWIVVAFVLLDTVGGVLVIRLAYVDKKISKALLLIWIGSTVDVLFWLVLIYGYPLMAVRRIVLNIFGGG